MADKIIVLRGEFSWCKLIGEPKPHTGTPKFDKGPYWSIDITPDAASRKILKEAGIASKLRQPYDGDFRKESYLTLTILEKNGKGEKNKPPVVQDGSGRPWGDDLIGNGSVGDVMIKVVDYGTTIGAYLQKVRVLKHVSYGGSDFEPLSESDEWYTPATAAGNEPSGASSDGNNAASRGNRSAQEIADLDDDIPF